MSTPPTKPGRRAILRSAATAVGLGSAAACAHVPPGGDPPGTRHESVADLRFAATPQVRLGVIGVGGRGEFLLGHFLAIEGIKVLAICDIRPDAAARAAEAVTKAGQPAPALYTAGERAFEALCRRDDLDLVLIATPWEWHVPMAVASMEAGHHAAVEVPAAMTIDDCWRLVDTSERTRRHCVMLENCCYGDNELMVLQMVEAGLLGEILHGEAAYIHDLRKILLSREGEGLWRRDWHTRFDGNLYPTHGLGPVARYMKVNRGDRFDRLVSMSGPSRGLQVYRDRTTAADDPRRRERYRTGDMNTSLLRTALGRTVVLQHDVVSARPYDRGNLVSGTKGTFRDYPPRIFLDGQKDEEWQTLDAFRAKYQHRLWREIGDNAVKHGGHGGMDFIMVWRLVQCLREGLLPDMDVYDAAAWSAPGPLSIMSVAQDNAPVQFPDFTRGRWQGAR